MSETWTLYAMLEPGAPWDRIYSGKHAEACKTEARRWYEMDESRKFRIYDPLERRVFESVPNNGWRMRWKWSNFEPLSGQ